MAPPKFDDLGKAGNELFTKGFEHGFVKLETKHVADGNEFTIKGNHNNDTADIKGTFEINVANVGKGLSYKHTFKTDSISDMEVSKSGLAKNLGKTTFTASLNHATNALALGKFKQNVAHDKLNLNLASTLSATPEVSLDAVGNYNSLNGGFSVLYDSKSGHIKKNLIGLNYQQGSVSATAKSALNNDVNVTFHNKVSDTKEIAVQANYGNNVNLALAGKNTGHDIGPIQFKLNHHGVLCHSVNTKINSGCSLTLSSMVNLTNLGGGGHKIGAQLKFT